MRFSVSFRGNHYPFKLQIRQKDLIKFEYITVSRTVRFHISQIIRIQLCGLGKIPILISFYKTEIKSIQLMYVNG